MTTATALDCAECEDEGTVECYECNGMGRIEQDCPECVDGFVETHFPSEKCDFPGDHTGCYESCDECLGSGNIAPDCEACEARGEVDCSECS